MVHLTAKILGLVISAIKNLRELRGSTPREILQYISSVYNISSAVARRQMQNALKRGVIYGILKKTGSHYSLPTDNEFARQEVTVQEIGMLDLYCQRKVHRSRGGRARRNSDAGRSRRVVCRCSRKDARRRSRECRSRSCRRRRRGRCGHADFERRVHDETTRPRVGLISPADKLTDKSTVSNRVTTGDDVIGGIERSNRSSMPSEQWDRSIPLSC
ncbi:PREDICTED: uncharacterized protein LOC105563289 [Vollenhovia emeryi]|uniref:uncharacterized protein LOC105563289 n=1 Tax=Vollenhovia emeryi TaxID=411798 RepID=UPI0005F569F7|nr:PREDICTED: uncharacterized protein LOC105563289 [Vollenhovia emeryi]